MDEIGSVLNTAGRDHSDSLSSDATQSTVSRAVLQHRLNQLLTCIDDMDAEMELHDKMSQTLDNAFFVYATRANKLRKKRFRWRTDSCLFCHAETRTSFIRQFFKFLFLSYSVPALSVYLYSLLALPPSDSSRVS